MTVLTPHRSLPAGLSKSASPDTDLAFTADDPLISDEPPPTQRHTFRPPGATFPGRCLQSQCGLNMKDRWEQLRWC